MVSHLVLAEEKAFSLFVVAFLLANLGCQQGNGRWDHYTSGGSFIGTRPSVSPSGKSIVYSSPRSGHGDIFLVNMEGSKTLQLTRDPNYEGDPAFSKDGKTIAFVRENEGISHIWVMNADGSEQKQLTREPDHDQGPSFSPDGRQILFVRQVGPSITSARVFVMNSDGTQQRRLARTNSRGWEASFSPNGQQVLFSVGSREIWMMDREGGNLHELMPTGASPSFSPDGNKIIFMSGKYGREMSLMSIDGLNAKVIRQSDKYNSYPSFCPDGSHVLFLEEDASPRGTGSICVMDLTRPTHIQRVSRTD